MNKYQVTFLLNTNEEQVISTFATTEDDAIQNAIYSISIHELEHWTLDNGELIDNAGDPVDDLRGEYINSRPLFSKGGGSIVVPNRYIYIDKIEIIKQTVTVKRGQLVDYSVPWNGGTNYPTMFDGRGVAWRRFENQHGTGWVLVDENNPSKNASIYDQYITAIDREHVEYNEDTRELFRTIWDDQTEAGE